MTLTIDPLSMMANTITLHDQDFHAWTVQQAALLKQGRLTDVDIEHIAEEPRP